MLNEKNKKLIKTVVTCIIVILVLWFVILNPILKFRSEEKTLTDSAKRYYEINQKSLPTGEKIATVSLQRLYDKDFISKDLKIPYSNKMCDAKTSFVKVKRVDGVYKYYTYLKCGVFSSSADHEGPIITLKGDEEITLNKGDKYKDAGVESVVDNTDGKIDIKKVTVDTTKVNTKKNGTYKVTYKIRDSFNNETVKERTIKVVQILDRIVKKETDKTNIYKGINYNNYVKLDGITFKIVGLNEDKTVKVVSDENLSFVDYNGVDDWLNNYFYNKLSDSAKNLIVEQKWCNDKVTNPETFTKCKSYSKNKNVGLLSVADINNSKDNDGEYNINNYKATWTYNSYNNKSISNIRQNYSADSKNENLTVKPAVNLKKDLYIISGSGMDSDPYILKENNKYVKVNEMISDAKIGSYIKYSGYNWRTIGKEEDGTLKIIMDEVISSQGDSLIMKFSENTSVVFNPNKKGNIGYKISNDISSYISSKMLKKKEIVINDYDGKLLYSTKTKQKKYKMYYSLPSIYELFSNSVEEYYWFSNYSSKSKKYCYMNNVGGFDYKKINNNDMYEIRLVSYLSKDVKVKAGKGLKNNPYMLAK